LAIGKPVALEASAELRETRGFISMMTMPAVARIDGELHVGAAPYPRRFRAGSVWRHRAFIWYSAVGEGLRPAPR